MLEEGAVARVRFVLRGGEVDELAAVASSGGSGDFRLRGIGIG